LYSIKIQSMSYKILSSIIVCLAFLMNTANAQQIRGKVTDSEGRALINVSVQIPALKTGVISDENGNYLFTNVRPGTYDLIASYVGNLPDTIRVTIATGQILTQDFRLSEDKVLSNVMITSARDFNNVKHMDEINGALIFAGKRNDVVILDKTNANTAENIPRQVFSKVPGVNEWDLDGSGVQTSISVRGLSPHRSWEFNVRQNGYSVNSDMFGYPESHYNPATEALKSVELIRGGACLQYGPQYGGTLNYVMKDGPTDKKFDIETRQSFGNNSMFNSYNAVGGQVGKLNYYAYFNYRGSDGYRPNDRYDFYAGYAGLKYQATDKLRLGLEFSKMYYVDEEAGGLTDAQFNANPYQSTRARNYFQPNHNIPALSVDYALSRNTLISFKSNMIIGHRNSVMFIKPATVPDTISATTLQYSPRTVDLDAYTSTTNELRLLQRYKIGSLEQALSAGLRFSNSMTHRQQDAEGTTGTDFDLTTLTPFKRDLHFRTINYAVSLENLFRITPRFSVTPGVRYEIIQTNMSGTADIVINPYDYNKNRNIPLFGIGMQYNLSNITNIYANWTQAYRPILYSDLTPTASLDIIDPNMKDSKGFNSDLGIRGKVQEYLTFDVGLFWLRYGDRIGALAMKNDNNQSYVYKTNIGTSEARGVETFIEFRPTQLPGVQSKFGQLAFFVSGSYDNAVYVDAITTANGQNVQLEGNTLENAPAWIVRGGISYNYRAISTTFQGSYTSEIYSDALNTPSSANGVIGIVPSYFILDWNTTLRFKNHYSVKFGLNNLNNEKYFTRRINNYPGPGILPADGRTFYVSLGKEF